MDIFDILNVVGGLCLFLFGMSGRPAPGFTPKSLRLTRKSTAFPINYLPKPPRINDSRWFLC